MSFNSLALLPSFDGYFREQGFKEPTGVQRKVVPGFLKRQSQVVVSETGSGKTLSYVLPMMHMLKVEEEKHGPTTERSTPRALVLAPTRELAAQIHAVFKSASHHVKLRVRLLTGGDSHERTKGLAHSTYDILVATPSRVKSALKHKELSLGHVRWLVLDEADNLFEMGFKRDVEQFLVDMDVDMLQLGFFTATLPPVFEEFLRTRFPSKKLEWVMSGDSHRPQVRIETYNVRTEPAEKDAIVRMFLQKQAKGRGIIFTNQRNQAEALHSFLKAKMPELKLRLLHGDMPAEERGDAIKSFLEKKAQVLVATDVAARGIDIDDLAWVVNYGLPKTAIYYLHRCGRVGRGGKTGVVYNLVASHDGKMIASINEAIQKQTHLPLQPIPDAKLNDKARDVARERAKQRAAKKAASVESRDRRARPGDALKRRAPTVKREKTRSPRPRR